MLFPKEEIPRRKSLKRMKVVDAGHDYNHVHFKCFHCDYDDGWKVWEGKTLTELKRGMPCPNCNEDFCDA